MHPINMDVFLQKGFTETSLKLVEIQSFNSLKKG